MQHVIIKFLAVSLLVHTVNQSAAGKNNPADNSVNDDSLNDDCHSSVTPRYERCLLARVDHAQETLKLYVAAAVKQMNRQDPSRGALKQFEDSEAKWAQYSLAECGAIDELWHAGSGHALMYLACQRKLTEDRSYEIWQNWLSFLGRYCPLPKPSLE